MKIEPDVPLRVAYEYGSLRDFFAAIAMLRVLSECSTESVNDLVAKRSYNLADAMLRERRMGMQE